MTTCSQKALNSTCRYLGGGFYLSCTIPFLGPKIIRMKLCGEQRAYLNAYAYAFDTTGSSYFHREREREQCGCPLQGPENIPLLGAGKRGFDSCY